MIDDDHELLQQYAATRNEAPFAEVVRRHLDLVYAAALRQTSGNVHLSREIAQSVFTDLARKADSLNRSTILVGWLHTAVRFAASKAIRSAARREHHERAASVEMNESLHSPDTPLDPAQLQPVIDAAIGDLKPREREAVLMRFFERREFADLGAKLALSESAARSCVDRALKKMRANLERRGVKSSGAALALALGNQTIIAAPAGLASAVILNATTAGAATVLPATLLFFTMTKLQYTLMGVLALGSGTSVALSFKLAERDQEIARLRSQSVQIEEIKHENTKLRNRLADSEAVRIAAQNPPAAVSQSPATQTDASTITPKTPDIEKELVRVEDFKNVGALTPAAAFQTMIWASIAGDDDTLASLISLDPESIKLGEEYLQKMPPATRQRFKSTQHLIGLYVADEIVRNASAAQIVKTNSKTHSQAELITKTTTATRQKPRQSSLPFVQVNGRWCFPVNHSLVEQTLKRLQSSDPLSGSHSP